MTATSTTEPSTLVYKYYRLLVIPALLWYLLMAYYTVTSTTGETITYAPWSTYIGVFLVVPLNILIGFFIMRRVPGNVIGPALIVIGCAITSELTINLIAPVALGTLKSSVLYAFVFPSFLILTAYFPSGKLQPPHVSGVVALVFMIFIVTAILNLLANPISYGTELWNGEGIANPFLIEALAPLSQNWDKIEAFVLGNLLLIFPLVAIYRYLRTTPFERAQQRFFLLMILLPINVILQPLQLNELTMISINRLMPLILMPIAIAISIIFYKLWGIDVIIRRTLIYAVVSALLALTYFSIVLVTQTLLSGFIPEDNTLLIVLSTLVIAALFNPLQQRVQRVIDRLFYRKRYDTDATLDQFSEKIRDAMDAQSIEQHVVDTVKNTIQPETISLWVVEKPRS